MTRHFNPTLTSLINTFKHTAKPYLTTRSILWYPYFTREFINYTDASEYGIGAVLAQMQNPALPDPSEANEADSADTGDREVVIGYCSGWGKS